MSAASAAALPPMCDIGINLLDAMFQGVYNGKQRHPADLDAVLERAASAGVSSLIVTGTDLRDARQAVELARAWNAKGQLPRLYTTVGVHPTSTKQLEGSHKRRHSVDTAQLVASVAEGGAGAGTGTTAATETEIATAHHAADEDWPRDRDAYIAALRQVIQDNARSAATSRSSGGSGSSSSSGHEPQSESEPVVVAIGECGLDYDRLHFSPQDVQLRQFEFHVDLAQEFGLPLFLHNRNTGGAEGDFCQLMRKHRHRFTHGVVHSFTGDAEELKALLDLGLHIGINGCSLKTADNLAVAAAVPLDRLLLETDAPWCGIRPTHASHAHVRKQWKSCKKEKYEAGALVRDRNEPCTMIQVAEVVAAIKGVPLAELLAAVAENTRTVFFPWQRAATTAAATAAS